VIRVLEKVQIVLGPPQVGSRLVARVALRVATMLRLISDMLSLPGLLRLDFGR